MPIRRRALMQAAAATLAFPAAAWAADTATAVETAAWESPRMIGDPKAPTHVVEYFSLTCTHCADFANNTFPEVEKKLIATGKIHYEFRDFPLDRVALQGEMIARALPVSEYTRFLLAMFASQDRWAFGASDPKAAIEKMALLAGMDKATFEAAWNDTALRNWVLAEQAKAQKQWGVDSTPTFIINGQKHPGEMTYAEFAKLIPNA